MCDTEMYICLFKFNVMGPEVSHQNYNVIMKILKYSVRSIFEILNGVFLLSRKMNANVSVQGLRFRIYLAYL